MNNKELLKGFFAAVFLLTFFLSAHTIIGQEEEHGFVGSRGCGMCHRPQRDAWRTHGHELMLRPVTDGAAPEDTNVTLPAGKSWSDIAYLVGGATYYARFIDGKGYVITGDGTQWSMKGNTLTPFKAEIPPGTLKYECIKCHTVGWKESGVYEKGVENTLEGIPGTWFENSVGCEACHGPGHEHAALKDKKDIKEQKGDLKIITGRDARKTSEMCGQCHKRSADDKIMLVSADMVMSRQQYTEMLYNKKATMKITCIACHDPHAGAASEDGFTRKCEDCHKGKFKMEVKIAAMSDLACVDCHMPPANRGAWDTMIKDYHKGDTLSHIFGISTDPGYKLDDGTGHASLNGDGFARLTVEMTCGRCHKSGDAHDMVRKEMLDMAKKIH